MIHVKFIDCRELLSKCEITLSDIPVRGDILDLDIGCFKVIKIERIFPAKAIMEEKIRYIQKDVIVYVEPEK